MSVHAHMTSFAGRRVYWYRPDGALSVNAPIWDWDSEQNEMVLPPAEEPPDEATDPSTIAYAMRGVDEEGGEEGPTLVEMIDRFVDDPQIGLVEAMVLGLWDSVDGDAEPVIEALVAARERFSGLKALFLGDIIGNESEISWIQQGNVGPLLEAYPTLEVFGVRGGGGLSFGDGVRHVHLRELRVETGGLPDEAMRSLWRTDLPALEQLVLWLGDPGYDGIDTTEPLDELLSGRLFPKLKQLGLCDSAIADQVAVAVASAPILERIETLDLSLGNMTDVGARALIASPSVQKLKRLDLTHHYISAEVIEELRQLRVEVVADDPQTPHTYDPPGGEQQIWRFIAHSE